MAVIAHADLRLCTASEKARFAEKLVVMPGGCVLWTGYRDRDGYGRLKLRGRIVAAHRALYATLVGEIPAGLELDHLCNTPACVNVAHLEPVDHRENSLRDGGFASANAAKQLCPAGHTYDTANTRMYHGRRHCRECDRARRRRNSPSL